jgi:hypothetical protein
MIARRPLWVVAMVAVASLGVALGVALAGSASPGTRTVTVAVRSTVSARTVIRVRTIERVRTRVKTVTVPAPAVHGPAASGRAVPPGSVRARGQASPSGGLTRPQQFSGTGPRVLGTITVGQRGGRLRWTNSAGRFRLLFNGAGVAVDSTAHSGQIAAPPLTYQQVTVSTQGRWIIQIG